MNSHRRNRPGFLLAVNAICRGIGLVGGIGCFAMTIMFWQGADSPIIRWLVATICGVVIYLLGRYLSIPVIIPGVLVIQNALYGHVLTDIEDRRQGLAPAEANAKRLMDERQWPSSYATLYSWGEQWPAWIRRQRLSTGLLWFATACGLAALIGGAGWLMQLANDVAQSTTKSVFGYVAILGGLLYGLSALMAKALPRLNLGHEVVSRLAQEALHAPVPKLEMQGQYDLDLPLGTPIVVSVDGYQLCISARFEGLPASIELIDQEILPLEDEDIDVGERAFDRATVVLPTSEHQGAACPTAWMTDEVRTLSLGLLNYGSRIDSDGFSAEIDLTDSNAILALARVTPLIDAMGLTCRNLSSLPIQERVYGALVNAASEFHRALLVEEVAKLPGQKVRNEIAARWILQGTGPSCSLMLTALTGDNVVRTLSALLHQDDGPNSLKRDGFAKLFEFDEDEGVRAFGERLALAATGDKSSIALVNDFCMQLCTMTFSSNGQSKLVTHMSSIQMPAEIRPALAMVVCRWPVDESTGLNLKRVRMWIEAASRTPSAQTLEQLSFIADQATHQVLATTARRAYDEVKSQLK